MTGIIPVIAVVFLAAVGVFADYYIKLSGEGPKYINYTYFFIGMAVYAMTAFGWFYAMKHMKLGTLGIFYSVTTSILLVIVGVLFFKEQLSVYNVIGIILGLASIILLAKFA